jgi:hypothetical protein
MIAMVGGRFGISSEWIEGQRGRDPGHVADEAD